MRPCSSGTSRPSTALPEGLAEVEVFAAVAATRRRAEPLRRRARLFVRDVTAAIIAGHGDELPVSALPVDGTFPTGTAQYEKRSIAPEIPIWDPSICIDCAKCTLVCPHAAIRMKVFAPDALEGALDGVRVEGVEGPRPCSGC